MLSESVWANIAQGNLLCNVSPQLKDSIYEENNPYNVASTMVEQHCIRILSSQCCPNTSETTLHKKIRYLRYVGPDHTDILSQENWLFEICLVSCVLTWYNITEQSWLFLFNVGSGVHLQLEDNNEQGPTITGTNLSIHGVTVR